MSFVNLLHVSPFWLEFTCEKLNWLDRIRKIPHLFLEDLTADNAYKKKAELRDRIVSGEGSENIIKYYKEINMQHQSTQLQSGLHNS